MLTLIAAAALTVPAPRPAVTDASPLVAKARVLQQDLIRKHLLEGLYVSIVRVTPPGTPVRHTVDEPGNVIHAGVWTGRYLAGVGYQYAVTHDPWVRQHGWELLRGLRRLQEVTGKPGLLARGYVKGHGPVAVYERNGTDTPEWHQGQGKFANYRWRGDVSVDNFNAVLFGYAIYYDLAADAAQKRFIAHDVDRLMTHVLRNHCRIIDVDGEVTLWGHIGIDPDPSRDDYYRKQYARYGMRFGMKGGAWTPPLRAELMLLPDLLIAHHVTGKRSYLDFYRRVVERFGPNPDRRRDSGPLTLQRLGRIDHSSEGQSYEALVNLIRLEADPKLRERYRSWVAPLWSDNWMEGNTLFAYMTAAMLGVRAPHGAPAIGPRASVPQMADGLRRAKETLRLYPLDRVFRPVMNSRREDIAQNPYASPDDGKLAAKPQPINVRPLDNEYAWKGNPYQLDGWLKPDVIAFATACDDPAVAWFVDSGGGLYMTRDAWRSWQSMAENLRGARITELAASPKRTFTLWAQTDQGEFVTHDGGMSWRPTTDPWPPTAQPSVPRPPTPDPSKWRIPVATYAFQTPRGTLAGGPGGAYLSRDGHAWRELKLWPEEETGPADYLHAYWMGRYYGWL